MIWDSNPWKLDLWRRAHRLAQLKGRAEWSERDGWALERDAFLGMFTIRRLLEAHKLSNRITELRLPARSWPRRAGGRMTYLNWDRIEEFFDFDAEDGSPKPMRVRELTNQLIHSYIFSSLSLDGEELMIAFASHRTRLAVLRALDMDLLVGLYRLVAMDDVAHVTAHYDDAVQDFRVEVGAPLLDSELERQLLGDDSIRRLLVASEVVINIGGSI
ncbi:MAG: hypothetical protein ACJ77A_15065 [Actinomycetota bacterium]